MNIAINGFGRIGRLVLREFFSGSYPDINIVAVNDLSSIKTSAHLFTYDTVHGVFKHDVTTENDVLVVDGKKIKYFSESDPTKLPWKDLQVDVVLECTGRFKSSSQCKSHIDAGCKKVIISAPGDSVDFTVVYGVNDNFLQKDHVYISNASCTTNCIAPVVKVLKESIGIISGHLSTIHSYTGDQRVVDIGHSDLRRARAAACNIIPTSTGAAKAIGEIFSDLRGKLTGAAYRVPVPNVSLVDFTFISEKSTSNEEINGLMLNASQKSKVLAYNDKPLVSSDFCSSSYSSVFDSTLTTVTDNTLCTVVAWYDNEYGFACRMLDVAKKISSFL